MLKLNEIVTSILKDIKKLSHQKQFYDLAVDKEQFPLVIFRFSNILDNEYREDVLLEIDIWHNSDATAIIELQEIADEIDSQLNRLKYLDEDIQTSIYRQSPYLLNLPDIDEGSKRKQLRYICKTYKR
jgi:hypothetical protein